MSPGAARLAVLYGGRHVGDLWPDNRALVLQYAPDWLGNADAHAENMALVTQPETRNGFRLAPAYDLLCTAVYESLDSRMAMAIGGEFRPD